MTDKKEAKAAPEEKLTQDELKSVAEKLTDEARKLLWRLGERLVTSLTLPEDQEPFDELAEEELAVGLSGGNAAVTVKGAQLNDYLGPYRKGIDPKADPKLKAPEDRDERAERLRDKHEEQAEEEAKVEEENRARAAKEQAKRDAEGRSAAKAEEHRKADNPSKAG